jgi:hypothetical protein
MCEHISSRSIRIFAIQILTLCVYMYLLPCICRSLALRGLARVVRVCTRYLISESWYTDMTWTRSLDACKLSVQAADEDLEVALAGVDALFSMLKTCTHSVHDSQDHLLGAGAGKDSKDSKDSKLTTPAKGKLSASTTKHTHTHAVPVPTGGAKLPSLDPASIIALESARSQLWTVTWRCVEECSRCSCTSLELPLQMLNSLSTLYSEGLDGAFRYSETVRVLLEIVVVLSRPRMRVSITNATSPSSPEDTTTHTNTDSSNNHEGYYELSPPSTSHNSRMLENQLHRSVIALLKSIRMNDLLVVSSLVSALAEIAFSCRLATAQSPFVGVGEGSGVVFLAPPPVRLRQEAAQLLIALLGTANTHGAQSANNTQTQSVGLKANTLAQGAELPKGSFAVVADIIFKRFLNDVCRDELLYRKQHLHADNDVSGFVCVQPKPKTTNAQTVAANNVLLVPVKGTVLRSSRGDDMFTDIFEVSAHQQDIQAHTQTYTQTTHTQTFTPQPNAANDDSSEGFLKSIERIWSNAIHSDTPAAAAAPAHTQSVPLTSRHSAGESRQQTDIHGAGMHRFPTMKMPKPTASTSLSAGFPQLQIQVTSPSKQYKNVEPVSWEDALYVPLDIELEVLNAALNIDAIVRTSSSAASTSEHGNAINEILLRNMVVCAACALSPWRKEELSLFPLAVQQELISSNTSNLAGNGVLLGNSTAGVSTPTMSDKDADSVGTSKEICMRQLAEYLDKLFCADMQVQVRPYEGQAIVVGALVQSATLMIHSLRAKLVSATSRQSSSAGSEEGESRNHHSSISSGESLGASAPRTPPPSISGLLIVLWCLHL